MPFSMPNICSSCFKPSPNPESIPLTQPSGRPAASVPGDATRFDTMLQQQHPANGAEGPSSPELHTPPERPSSPANTGAVAPGSHYDPSGYSMARPSSPANTGAGASGSQGRPQGGFNIFDAGSYPPARPSSPVNTGAGASGSQGRPQGGFNIYNAGSYEQQDAALQEKIREAQAAKDQQALVKEKPPAGQNIAESSGLTENSRQAQVHAHRNAVADIGSGMDLENAIQKNNITDPNSLIALRFLDRGTWTEAKAISGYEPIVVQPRDVRPKEGASSSKPE